MWKSVSMKGISFMHVENGRVWQTGAKCLSDITGNMMCVVKVKFDQSPTENC